MGQQGKGRRAGLRVRAEELESRRLLSQAGATTPAGAGSATSLAEYGRLPLAFVPNLGQDDPSVDFTAIGGGRSVAIGPDGATINLAGTTVSLALVGANPDPRVTGLDPLPGRINLIFGKNPADWHLGLTADARVAVQGVYPGVDLAYHGNPSQLEYDVRLAAGVDPGVIRWKVSGASSVAIDAAGDLVLSTATGDVVEQAPVMYQTTAAGAHVPISGGYILEADGTVGFHVGAHDTSLPLTIDPVLAYSTYLGGTQGAVGLSVAVDAAGEAFVAGTSSSTDFAGTSQGTPNNAPMAFVAKLNPSGTAIDYLTFFSGASFSPTVAIAIDALGDAYVAGSTANDGFPTTPGAFQTEVKGFEDGFVAKLNPMGNAVYATYLGGGTGFLGGAGKAITDLTGIAVTAGLQVVVSGTTDASDFPTTPGALETTIPTAAAFTGFVTELSADGSSLVYSTYLGGQDETFTTGVAVDTAGDAYVTGSTAAADFPTKNALQPAPGSGAVAYSNDGGASFAAPAGGLTGEVRTLAPSPSTPTTIYAGTALNGAYRSTDGGTTWTPIDSGVTPQFDNALAVDPNTATTVYLATSAGLFKSTDGGATWSESDSGMGDGMDVTAVAVDPVTPSTLYAGTAGSGAFTSTDGGATWAAVGNGLTGKYVSSIAVAPVVGGGPPVVLATTYDTASGVINRSTDGGATWIAVAKGAFALAVDPSNPSTMYAAGESNLLKSADGGATWTTVSTPNAGGDTFIKSIAVDPQNSQNVTLGLISLRPKYISIPAVSPAINSGLMRSTDGGKTFDVISVPGLPALRSTLDVAYAATNPSTLYAGSAQNLTGFVTELDPTGSGLVYSTYLGGSGDDAPMAIAVDRATGEAYVAGTTDSADFPTTNGAVQPNFSASVGTSIFASGGGNAFVTEIAPGGGSLAGSTYLGPGGTYATAIAVDGAGNAYVTGVISASGLPMVDAVQPAYNSATDAFMVALNPGVTKVVGSTYLGGSASDEGSGIAVDPEGTVFVTGATYSTNFPTRNSLQASPPATGGANNIFVTALNPSSPRPIPTSTHVTSKRTTILGEADLVATIRVPTGGRIVRSGVVDFVDTASGQNLGTVPIRGGKAALVATGLAPGTHQVLVSFAGVPGYQPSRGVATVTVPRFPSATTLVAMPTRSTFGHPVTFTATVVPGVAAVASKFAPGGLVEFVRAGRVLGVVPLNARDQATLTTSALPAPGDTITAVYLGNSTYLGGSSTPVTVAIAADDGPRVVRVQRHGDLAMPTTLDLTFNAPLDRATAENVHNYRISGPAGGTIPVASATYNPTLQTVTLNPARRLHVNDRYRLQVNGRAPTGVRGTSGALLDGLGNGRAGSDFVTVVSVRSGAHRRVPGAR